MEIFNVYLGIFHLKSAYFNANVSVSITKNDQITSEAERPLIFDRKVHLICLEKPLCVAESIITISNEDYIKLIASKQVGIGQFFRYLNVLPEFTLLEVQRTSDGFWRKYKLETPGMVCEIKESFPTGLFSDDVKPTDGSIHLQRVNNTSTYHAPS